MLAFGPVPSRRLGRSLGVNNIPPKVCTYSCVYCQLGRTPKMQVERERFYGPEEVVATVKAKIGEAEDREEPIDYVTFVPDGEPTLDINLGEEIDGIKELGVKVAVISNGSLVWKEEVRDELERADWVSLKIDAAQEDTWRKMNRPHGSLRFEKILEGMMHFSQSSEGELATETMLVPGINDMAGEINKIVELVSEMKPAKSFIAIPTRPPSESWVRMPSEEAVNAAYQVFSSRGIETEYLIGFEGTAFASTGDAEEDLLAITSVHPMRKDAVREFLERADAEWKLIENLVRANRLVAVDHEGMRFYVRRLVPGLES